MLTGNNGQFSFNGVPAGLRMLLVNKPSFRSRGGFLQGMAMAVHRGPGMIHPDPPMQIEVGPDMPNLTVPVNPLGMITGHVTLSTADPADNIRLQVLVRSLENGRPHWTLAGQSRIRSDGSFRIANLEPGSYMIATMASLDRPGQALNGRGPIWGYPSLYYPGVTDPGAAGVLHLGAGQQAEADITLTRQQFFPVTALVHSSTDSPANFEILDSGGRQTGLSASFDRREGILRAAVPNGTWTLQAHAYGRSREWGSTTFQVNGVPASFAISLQTVPRIPIVVHREFQASADGSQPDPAASGPGMNITLIGADEMGPGSVGGGMAPAEGSDGTQWELRVGDPGRYWLAVLPFIPFAYVSSVTSGGTDLGSNPLVIVPGSTPPPIEVTLRNDGGTITGQIAGLPTSTTGSAQASSQRPQLWIYTIPLFSTAAHLPEGTVQANGQFTIPNLAPGSYRVVACDAPQEIDFHSPEGLAAWAGKGQTVTVDPGGTASVDLDVVHMNSEEAQ